MSMCLDVTGFMKDNKNARKDLAALCDRPLLEAKPNARGKLGRPKAPYFLKPTERKEVLRWLKTLKFPYRYMANIK
jgi:predicted ArsR family transcriptional regulator